MHSRAESNSSHWKNYQQASVTKQANHVNFNCVDSFSLSKTFSYITIIRDISNSHDLKNSFGHAVIATLFQEVHREVRQEEGKPASIMFANSF